MAKTYFRATETFHCDESAVPILRGDVLAGDNPVVKNHPVFFVSVDEDNVASEARWETATGTPEVAPKRAPKRSAE